MSCGKCAGQCESISTETAKPLDTKVHVLELRVQVLEAYLSNVSKQLLVMEEILKKITDKLD